MTASVRIWPQEVAKTSSAPGGQERFLSAVGQRAVLVPASALAAKQGLPERSQRSILIAMARKGRTRTRRTSALGGYTTPEDIQDLANLAELGRFCRRLGREAKQGEVGLVVGDEYFAIRQFEEV